MTQNNHFFNGGPAIGQKFTNQKRCDFFFLTLIVFSPLAKVLPSIESTTVDLLILYYEKVNPNSFVQILLESMLLQWNLRERDTLGPI